MGGCLNLSEAMREVLVIPGQVGLDEMVINWIKSIEVDVHCRGGVVRWRYGGGRWEWKRRTCTV